MEHGVTARIPTTVYELIEDTFTVNKKDVNDSYANSLIKILKINRFWPSMQVKKFKNNENIVLLHNTYKRDDIGRFKEIYEQCRSIVLDFSLQLNNNVVVSYANNIPMRIDINEYSQNVCDSDKYHEAYDGTMISVYNYQDKWYFGTSSCPDVNSSKFSNPNKSHGEMLDEVLLTYFRSHVSDEEIALGYNENISAKLRNIFTSQLDPLFAYEFVIIHSDNVHIIDYTIVYGSGYKILYHINTKNRMDLSEVDISTQPLAGIGILYPRYFVNLNEAYNHITNNVSYGFVVKKNTQMGTKLYKISTADIEFKEDTNPCNPNIWHNLLSVYMKNRKDFQINDYIQMYAPDIQLPIDDKGRTIDPTYIIHTMISTIKDVLYDLYIATTTYNSKTNRFKMNKELDAQFPPVIRFHLAQLRYKQQNENSNTMIRPKDVYYYICHCNNIKNIKLLITLFATTTGYNITKRASMCFTILNGLL